MQKSEAQKLAYERLVAELKKGQKSGEDNGWLTPDDVRNHFNERNITHTEPLE